MVSRVKRHLEVFLSTCAVLSACGSEPESNPDLADILIHNARIYTVGESNPWAQAAAIRDGRFVYVGDNAGVHAFHGPDTLSFDLGGKMVLPGLIDSHTHPGYIAIQGNEDTSKNLPYPATQAEILAWLGDFAAANPEPELIVTGNWQVDIFGVEGPHKEDLDAVVPDRPVILLDDSGHSQWVNSAFLKQIGVDKDTPDEVPGVSFFSRDANGEPTGWVKEAGMLRHFSINGALLPEHHELVERMERVVHHLSRSGVTSLLDAGNMGIEDRIYAAVAELDRSERLPLRYEATYHIRLPDQVPNAIEELKRLRAQYAGERLRFNTVKIHFDGINELRTASVLEPYSDDPGNIGGTTISGEVLEQFILELNEEVIDLHLHTNSDGAARVALDAVGGARERAGGELDTRVTLCHLELLHEDDSGRFRELGVIANFTLHWNGIGYLSSWGPSIGPERTAQRFRIRPLIEDGAIVTYSSDETTIAGLARTSPFFSMQIGHNRQEVDAAPDSEILAPVEERLDLADIVDGYTKAGAYQLRAENDLGTIEVGKVADLVVLNQDFFEVDRHQIHTTAPTAVMLAGELVQGSLR
ncbi:MAG: amidohydrolase [Deltaproteobacteria bacterium]|nr:amidohydrolase [Deltaproteobacteria bacterium]MBW2691069.1 amidohydrolase [Deltaproteobacteria bacterium]